MMPLGSFEAEILLETTKITTTNLRAALDLLRGCWKSSSLLWMRSNEFPVLSGVILNKWTKEAGAAVSHFCNERNLSELLVRIEKPGQRWIRRRGGYTIRVAAARDLVEELSRAGMLVILLEPASPYSDVYSLTSVCDLAVGRMDVEVVGPGFDASDVLRSDVTPHERFEVSITEGDQFGKAQDCEVRRSYLIEPEAYRVSVQRRLTKVGARLRNPSFPDEELRVFDSDQLAQEGLLYLKKSGQTILLDHLNHYDPIPRGMLELFLVQLQRLCSLMVQSQIRRQLLSVAASFLAQRRLIMWDFFPAGNADTRILP